MHPHRGFFMPIFRRYPMKNNSSGLTGVRKTGLDRNYEMSICQAGLDNEKPLYSVKT